MRRSGWPWATLCAICAVLATLPAAARAGQPAARQPTAPKSLPDGMTKAAEKGVYTWGRDGAEMVWVPGGAFLRGSPGGQDSDEAPAAQIEVSAYFIDRHEVTNEMYRRFFDWWQTATNEERQRVSHPDQPEQLDHRPAYWPVPQDGEEAPTPAPDAWSRDDHPVVGVTWFSAYAYARWAGKDLPSEAEWEKAASFDPVGPKRQYPWGTEVPDFTRCNFKGNVSRPVRPGQYKQGASALGARDMAGNVWEWCHDYYHENFYKTDAGQEADPLNQFPAAFRSVRGGAYGSHADEVRTAYRDRADPRKTYRDVGFRCVKHVGK